MRISDWSSDVCSSDLIQDFKSAERRKRIRAEHGHALIGDKPVEALLVFAKVFPQLLCQQGRRSEERRGGKECVSTGRSRWSPYDSTNKQHHIYYSDKNIHSSQNILKLAHANTL